MTSLLLLILVVSNVFVSGQMSTQQIQIENKKTESENIPNQPLNKSTLSELLKQINNINEKNKQQSLELSSLKNSTSHIIQQQKADLKYLKNENQKQDQKMKDFISTINSLKSKITKIETLQSSIAKTIPKSPVLLGPFFSEQEHWDTTPPQLQVLIHPFVFTKLTLEKKSLATLTANGLINTHGQQVYYYFLKDNKPLPGHFIQICENPGWGPLSFVQEVVLEPGESLIQFAYHCQVCSSKIVHLWNLSFTIKVQELNEVS